MSRSAKAENGTMRLTAAQARKRVMNISVGTTAFIVAQLPHARGPQLGDASRRSHAAWHSAAALIALVAPALLAGCGSLPLNVDRPPSIAIGPSPESALVRIADNSRPAPELSGFRLMPLGVYSLDARVALANKARYSLDIQYYL